MRIKAPSPRLALLGLLALPVLGTAASAKDSEVNPVTRHMESIEVAQGIEHRLVVVHPVIGRANPEKGTEPVLLGGSASPDLIAFGQMEKAAKPKSEALTFTTGPTVLLAGDVLRTATADFAVDRDTVVPSGRPLVVPFMKISREVEADPKAVEPTMLGQVLTSDLRYLLLSDASSTAVREQAERLADEIHLPPGRRSPADISSVELLAKRAADYRRHFAAFVQPLPAGREVVGCAVLVNGVVTEFETFGTGKLFTSAWPRLLDGIAAEASIEEARVGLLTEDLPDSADPDRYLTDVKQRLLDVFGARIASHDVHEDAKELELDVKDAVAQALVLGEDRVIHFVLVTDPAHRHDKKPTEGPDPHVAARKAHQTEEEKRLLERRAGGGPLPQPPEPPAPPQK